MSQQHQIPGTPRVISPTPTPSETRDNGDDYFAPITRSTAAKQSKSPAPIEEEKDNDSELEKRARLRSRSPESSARRRRYSGHASAKANPLPPLSTTPSSTKKNAGQAAPNGSSNGHLSPDSAQSSYWRDLSRSPSPLGLIPIHRHWRSFIHRHEIPRKALHISIGFYGIYLYLSGVQTPSLHPYLLGALIPIACVEVLRRRSPSFNRVYVMVLGALMREEEVNDKYNGVIWYLLGSWAAVRFYPRDIAVVSVMLLSWCDTAASTFGRLYGRYTPRIRKGKSLAGSAAAAVVGVLTAAFFWGYLMPSSWGYAEEASAFKGTLRLPSIVKNTLGWPGENRGVVGGSFAICILSIWTGFVASASEVVDLWGLDDNITIPVLSGLGLWGFLKVFG